MDKKSLTERDICTKFITSAIQQAGWDIHKQIREEVSFTKGRIIVRGKLHSRGEAKRADYVLYHQPNLPIAVIEAKPLDPFDQPPLSRREHAEQVKKRNYLARYSGAARQVLEALLDKYADTDTGIEHIEDIKILQLDPFSQIGAPIELVKAFGGKPGYQKAIHALEAELYAS